MRDSKKIATMDIGELVETIESEEDETDDEEDDDEHDGENDNQTTGSKHYPEEKEASRARIKTLQGIV